VKRRTGSAERIRRVELVVVGTEMLALGARDTNSDFLKPDLLELGYEPGLISIVPDEQERIVEVVRAALRRASLVVVGGGLGPTGDDRTRQALARVFGAGLRRDPRAWERVARWYRARGRFPGSGARLQALVPIGAESLDNPIGSASGIWWARGDRRVVALPGVPSELKAMWKEAVRPRLEAGGGSVPVASFSLGGLPEADVDARLAELYRRPDVEMTILAKTEHIEVHLRGKRASPAARRAVDRAAALVRRRLGRRIFAEGERTLEQAIGERLRERGETLAVAESCTGGLVGARITTVPGSSDYFVGGVTAYSNAVKRKVLGVPETILRRQGAVSAPCARALANEVCRRLGSDWGLSVTGVAGPGGGAPGKPVGTVFIGLARRGRRVSARALRLVGDRDSVRRRAAAAALLWLHRALGAGPGARRRK